MFLGSNLLSQGGEEGKISITVKMLDRSRLLLLLLPPFQTFTLQYDGSVMFRLQMAFWVRDL